MSFLHFIEFLLLKRPHAAVGHMEAVEQEKNRVVHGAAQLHDVVHDFVHGINAERQRDIARREE